MAEDPRLLTGGVWGAILGALIGSLVAAALRLRRRDESRRLGGSE
jgi:hypothetical protein